MTQIQTAAIYDAEDELTYTACIQRNGTGWTGWIQEYLIVGAAARVGGKPLNS